jgi:glucan 1,3-beta-glucosidase
MAVPRLLREPFVPFTVVAGAIALFWFWMGLPVGMPRAPLAAGAKLDCLSYSPAAPDFALTGRAQLSRERAEREIAWLAPHTACLRTDAASGGLELVPEIAREHRIAVLQGVRLGRDAERNRAEIQAAIALARAEKQSIRALVVGTGAISRGDLSAGQLGAMLRSLRAETGLPVTYADHWETWLATPELAGFVDFITIQVPLYRAEIPVTARDAARHVVEARARVASTFAGREILVTDIGWPSAGPMREAALPSRANQARVLHEVLAAAALRNFSVNLFEAFDRSWRHRREGTAGAHWGLFDPATGAAMFRWGHALIEHPLWFYQGLVGVLFAAVIFAAGYLARRSLSVPVPPGGDWLKVGLMALGGALLVGLAMTRVPLESGSLIEWAHSFFLLFLALSVPPVAAAALMRRTRFEGFAAVLDPILRPAIDPLARVAALLLLLTSAAAIQLALAFVFDPEMRDFPFAPLTGPAVAFVTLALFNPPGERRSYAAEAAAAIILAGGALLCAVNATVSNWQALWFAATLAALALAVWRARGVRTR